MGWLGTYVQYSTVGCPYCTLRGTSFGAMRVRGWMCRCWLSEGESESEDERAQSRTSVAEERVYCFALATIFDHRCIICVNAIWRPTA
jgi:hypothetical protein